MTTEAQMNLLITGSVEHSESIIKLLRLEGNWTPCAFGQALLGHRVAQAIIAVKPSVREQVWVEEVLYLKFGPGERSVVIL